MILLSLFLIGCLIGFLLTLTVFVPPTYRFFREEFAGDFPFDRPVWAYRLRHWWQDVMRRWRRRRSLIWHSITEWWAVRADDLGGLALIIGIICLLWVAFIITTP